MSSLTSFLKSQWKWLLGAVVVIIVLVVILLWPVAQPSVAVLMVQPGDQKVTAGQQFTVQVQVSSSQPANAVDATVSYPSDLLTVASTSTKKSRFDMVLFPPQIIKDKGTVRFLQASAIPFSGNTSQGSIGSITFKAVKDGTATFSISGKVVANTSKGDDLTAKLPSKPRWQTLFK